MNFKFGYPVDCSKCSDYGLKVTPFFQSGNHIRLMLVGQDPTIKRGGDNVEEVLMLNDPASQLSRWLKELFGRALFEELTIYATNVVKCTFPNTPSSIAGGALKFLRRYFKECKPLFNPRDLSFSTGHFNNPWRASTYSIQTIA